MVMPQDPTMGQFIAAGTRVKPEVFSRLLGNMRAGRPAPDGRWVTRNYSFGTREDRDIAEFLFDTYLRWIDKQNQKGT
jgi:hypothetical protein